MRKWKLPIMDSNSKTFKLYDIKCFPNKYITLTSKQQPFILSVVLCEFWNKNQGIALQTEKDTALHFLICLSQ